MIGLSGASEEHPGQSVLAWPEYVAELDLQHGGMHGGMHGGIHAKDAATIHVAVGRSS